MPRLLTQRPAELVKPAAGVRSTAALSAAASAAVSAAAASSASASAVHGEDDGSARAESECRAAFGNIVRSKGTLWVNKSDTCAAVWSQVRSHIVVRPAGAWPMGAPTTCITFLGAGMRTAELDAALRSCLVTGVCDVSAADTFDDWNTTNRFRLLA